MKPFYHEPYPKGYTMPVNPLDELYPFAKFKGTNARQIIKAKLDKFRVSRSESLKQQLEDLGFTCDYSPMDEGEEPIRIKE
jgi:hypothetical protein